MEVSNGLMDAFARLDALLADRLPDMAAALRPGADERALAEFEAAFGTELPAEFRKLYQWHDGADFAGYHSLPGIGHWRPLFLLPDRCLEWQASWDLGFDPRWIPFTVEDYGQTVYAVDAGGDPQAPAPVLFYEIPDGVLRSGGSIEETIEQMIALVERGAYGRDVAPPDESLTLFAGGAVLDQELPDAVPPDRFSIPQRFDHDPAPGADVPATYQALLAAMRDLVAVAEREAGRDGHAVLPQTAGLLRYYEDRVADDVHSLAPEAGTLRGELERRA